MGAIDFTATAKGKTAREAFDTATREARYEHGHGGYTGTIAEKREFRVVACPPGKSPRDTIFEIMNGDSPIGYNHWAFDKWGPAAAIQTGDDEWTFFGTASS